jgi:hypothetical protein
MFHLEEDCNVLYLLLAWRQDRRRTSIVDQDGVTDEQRDVFTLRIGRILNKIIISCDFYYFKYELLRQHSTPFLRKIFYNKVILINYSILQKTHDFCELHQYVRVFSKVSVGVYDTVKIILAEFYNWNCIKVFFY